MRPICNEIAPVVMLQLSPLISWKFYTGDIEPEFVER
jgi:hypothetical protein